jgi:hypothetical protein
MKMLSERQNMREVLRLSMRVSAGVYLANPLASRVRKTSKQGIVEGSLTCRSIMMEAVRTW